MTTTDDKQKKKELRYLLFLPMEISVERLRKWMGFKPTKNWPVHREREIGALCLLVCVCLEFIRSF